MNKTKQGTKKEVMWRATCGECASEFEEAVGNLNVEHDRDGSLARAKCPDCKTEMFFYPPSSKSYSQWGDH
jgi:hypothetical protein